MFESLLPTAIQQINLDSVREMGVELYVKRDDLIDKNISGNKWRKLKFNIAKAKELGANRILTFGGAYSNHIAATASLASFVDIELHAFIRGEELNPNSNPTLQKASSQGLKLHFISRSEYSEFKKTESVSQLGEEWGNTWIIPEGGANKEGVLGCEEIYRELDQKFDYICLSAGTGTTAAGILKEIKDETLMVFSALKGGNFLRRDILKWQDESFNKEAQLKLLSNFHFGGYGKVDQNLISFVRSIKDEISLPLDYIYTAKAFYGMLQLIEKREFSKGSKILFYHSGGLQGNDSIDGTIQS
jgi:1-aminocyclopropane-1-carboxylate deaminase